MRLWIASLLLLVFACQALPVATFGKSLLKAKYAVSDDLDGDTDEDSDSIPEGGKLKKQSPVFGDDYVGFSRVSSERVSLQAAQQITLHRPDHLPVIYAGEVLTPPPNCC